MVRSAILLASVASILIASPALGNADLKEVIKCQNRIAKAGAKYASTVISKTLKCTNAIVECQINCENGVYGTPCDPDDRNSNSAFGECMDDADELCAKQTEKIDLGEVKKRLKITLACGNLSNDQLCGANTPGLNFEYLSAGCQAIIPGWTCDLQGILDCVAGPLQQEAAEEMVALLDPRSGEALAALGTTNLEGISQTVKVFEALPPGLFDIWSIDGLAGDEIVVHVKTMDDLGGLSNLQPRLTYVSLDGSTPVPNTNVVQTSCGIPNTCGQPCESFTRIFPFDGTFFLAVEAHTGNGCGGGSYRLKVTTSNGAAPTLVANDVSMIGSASKAFVLPTSTLLR